MTPDPELRSSVSVATLQGQLSALAQHIQAAARRSRRLSWLSVGYIVAAAAGVGLAYTIELLILITTPLSSHTSPISFQWPFLVAPIVPLALAILAVREVVLGLREGEEPLVPSTASSSVAPVSGASGWTEMVQQSQQLITHMKSETQFSFVWFVLGTFGLSSTVGSVVLSMFTSSQSSLGAFTFLLTYVLAFSFLFLLIPFYIAASDWIRNYQELLDWEVNGLSRLEAEFFTRFARLAIPT